MHPHVRPEQVCLKSNWDLSFYLPSPLVCSSLSLSQTLFLVLFLSSCSIPLCFYLHSFFSYTIRMNNLYESQALYPGSLIVTSPPLVLLAELLLASSIHIIIWCPMWFHWKKKERHCLSGAALACNPTQWSFQPTSDCLIGIHCCVCQECWQYIAVICIKQEGAQIPLLFHVSLPLLHPKEISECDSQTRNYKRQENHISWPCAVLH